MTTSRGLLRTRRTRGRAAGALAALGVFGALSVVHGNGPAAEPAGPAPPPRAVRLGCGVVLVRVPGGTFAMGRPGPGFASVGAEPPAGEGRPAPPRRAKAAPRRDDEGPRHPVHITRAFYAQTTEVTQAQFRAVMGYNRSYFRPGVAAGLSDTDDHPVERVSHAEAVEFCRRLALREHLPPGSVRLPTEAEWEYLARAGADDGGPAAPGWFADNSGGKTRPVGRLRPNALGLYDLHGNVAEWTADWYGRDYYAESPADDPRGPEPAPGRREKVIRGGGFATPAAAYRPTDRRPCSPAAASQKDVGFRVVFSTGR